MRPTRNFCRRKLGMGDLEVAVGAVCGPRGKLDASQPLGQRGKNGKTHPFTLFEK